MTIALSWVGAQRGDNLTTLTTLYLFGTRSRSPKEIVSEQAGALWSAIKQKSVWLPALFIFLWRATPSSDSAFFFFLTNDIGECGCGAGARSLGGHPFLSLFHVACLLFVLVVFSRCCHVMCMRWSVSAMCLNDRYPSTSACLLQCHYLGIGPEFLGRVRLGSSIASLGGVWIFQTFLKETKISTVLFWSTLLAVPLGFSQVTVDALL